MTVVFARLLHVKQLKYWEGSVSEYMRWLYTSGDQGGHPTLGRKRLSLLSAV